MVATKGQAIALGVVSVLTLGAGIAVMVLFHSLFEALGISGGNLPAVSLYWPYGVPVLIVGVLGIVAAAVRNNVGVGIYMAICIICLVVEAAFIVLIGMVLFVLLTVDVAPRDCFMIAGSCNCLNTGLPPVGASTCQDPNVTVFHLTRAGCALIVVSWVLMLAGSIISCAACCCGKPTHTPGTIIVQGSPGYEMGYPGGGGYAPAQHGGYGGQYPAK